MLKSIQQRDLDKNRWIKITMAVILGIICISMVVTLVPGLMSGDASTDNGDTVATVGGQDISSVDLQQQINLVTRNQQIPDSFRGLYAKQILDQMVFQHALDLEAQRLNITVTPQEEAKTLREIMPDAWNGNTWDKDRYVSEVESRGLTVPQFESELHDDLLAQKFREIATAGITVTPAEVAAQFQWQNEKVKIQYVLLKPSVLAPTIQPSDADLAAYFSRNESKYQIPEKRSSQYALLDLNTLRATTKISDDALRMYYNAHLDDYKVPNRAHVEHILFKTVGMTDAEIAEVRKKAEDVLNQAKHGANFEDLAKKYSEDDGSKAKGGDLGWILEGQTVPEFQQVAFSLPKGSISDLVKTQYGFHIIKVLDRETAHTKSLDEVKSMIEDMMLADKVSSEADDISNQMAEAVRQSDRQPIADIAKKFNLQVGQVQPVSFTEPVGPLGNSPDVHSALFQSRPGELSQPIRLQQGYAILTVDKIFPAHQAMLAEVHDKVFADYQNEKAVELASSKAQDIAKAVRGGTPFDKAAKDLGLDVTTSDAFARNGNVPNVGTGSQLQSAFTMKKDEVSAPLHIGDNWVVYEVAEHDIPDPSDLAKQSKTISDQLLATKQEAVFDAFRTALEDRLKKEGKITINNEVFQRVVSQSS